MIGLFAPTHTGRRRASELAARFGADALVVEGPVGPSLRRVWDRLSGVVLFLGTGSAVRSVAPLLTGERTDPAVVCVDADGRFAVVLSGAGGNALALQVADVLDAVAVTVEQEHVTGPLDELVDALDATVDGDVTECSAAVADGEPVGLSNPHGFPLPALPDTVSPDAASPQWTIALDDRRPADADRARLLWLVPRTLIVGVGASREASRTEIVEAVALLEREYSLDPRAVRAIATVARAEDHPGLAEAVQDLGFWHSEEGGDELPLRVFPADVLDRVDVPSPSGAVRDRVGTGSVAEAAALAAATEDAAGGPVDLVVPKLTSRRVTVAAARLRPRGRLAVVGVGPGPDDLRTPRADAELRRAAVVVGSRAVLDRVGRVLSPDARTEVGVVADAVDVAASGRAVAFAHTGEVEQVDAERAAVEVVVVPGVSRGVTGPVD
ncbi:precorrin methylase [Allosaccharopolyspora coralli]|uniref:Precorrin methylase n=1 Tax=Allosaccharopolyspora coralli TaxID=2665642 RepID=A0A5Q3Q924_9PSEU|nr:cobalamin biosynthesis protein [Allosaccharopolyspora coralli]QGK70972.1 precorrin methylase [Allosaccharopolyspora coralli]